MFWVVWQKSLFPRGFLFMFWLSIGFVRVCECLFLFLSDEDVFSMVKSAVNLVLLLL